MITKELLSKALGNEVLWLDITDEGKIEYEIIDYTQRGNRYQDTISHAEVADLCETWAFKQGCTIITYQIKDAYRNYEIRMFRDFSWNTFEKGDCIFERWNFKDRHEAVFAACETLL